MDQGRRAPTRARPRDPLPPLPQCHPQRGRETTRPEWQLHTELYFLALAVRRVLLFFDLIADQVHDPRLTEARATFDQRAAEAKKLRDFFEHLGEYLLDSPRKHQKFPGRASPVLRCHWRYDNVEVLFGPNSIDITVAAGEAVRLGRACLTVWEEHLDAAEAARDRPDLPPPDDGVPRMMHVTFGRSTVIADDEPGPEVITGTLLDFGVSECTPEEADGT